MPVAGYYDGTVVRVEAPLQPNQRVIVIPIETGEAEQETASGSLSKYANPDLIPMEKDAWRKAAIEKHVNG